MREKSGIVRLRTHVRETYAKPEREENFGLFRALTQFIKSIHLRAVVQKKT